VEWLFFSFLRYLLSLGIALFLLLPLVRFTLIQVFERLPRAGPTQALRQLLAFPVIGLLGRERRARRGDYKSLFELFLCQLAGAFLVSLLIQSFIATLIFTLVFMILAYWLIK
jgi:hypothetical protein